ncbi:hypothetical protein CHH28_18820 [Bacterioplanes sanyensis]|uniref:STAS domain-containing protein n=1 Tax=Bacterioplanes sanyensis TaxID=1249553 RepID=A0A222FQ01_9GAMM|nr:STAS domain-containing protein [Bacterioplanes sanyensis]ASP40594.1 hypothetical protein CHH28_18820 [Bacterioplanes sanyensis]
MPHTLSCGARLSIDQAEHLHSQFQAALSSPEPLLIDAGDVQYADSAGLQLLLALKQSLAGSGQSFSWGNVSDVVYECADLLGLTAQLSLSDIIKE